MNNIVAFHIVILFICIVYWIGQDSKSPGRKKKWVWVAGKLWVLLWHYGNNAESCCPLWALQHVLGIQIPMRYTCMSTTRPKQSEGIQGYYTQNNSFLPRVGFENTTLCSLREHSTNWTTRETQQVEVWIYNTRQRHTTNHCAMHSILS